MKMQALALMLATALPAAPALAQKCPAPEIFNSLTMLRQPGDSRDFVPIAINGQTRHFLLDTGGSYTSMRRSVAQDLKLQIRGSDTLRLRDVAANLSQFEALVDHFEIGQMHADRVNFAISPEGKGGGVSRTASMRWITCSAMTLIWISASPTS